MNTSDLNGMVILPEEEDFNERDFWEEADDPLILPLHLELELKKQARSENKPRKMRNGYYSD